ncbi:MAG: Zn-ribbon domain-containing OB-fold protein, partial [Desulfatitalea sp.]|nr:Zn-ribbon domain-containing OB-fold protein [Desulfatitalea sp.]NNK01521.1 Zn-ribbon domain-containing OB-fold protein [Desulfatitalea sp.]
MAGTDSNIVIHKTFELEYGCYTGPIIGKFLTELRDNKKIMGIRCPECGKVFCPPVDFCPDCFIAPTDWVEVKDEGVMISHTEVFKDFPGQPHGAPYVVGLFKLDGADTPMVHLLFWTTDVFYVKSNMHVKAVWKENREGSIR